MHFEAFTKYDEVFNTYGQYKREEDMFVHLADHQSAVEKKIQQSILEEEAFQHDSLLHPHDERHDQWDKLIFYHSPVKDLLHQDIKAGAYPHLSPMQLWNMREEYKLFDLTVF